MIYHIELYQAGFTGRRRFASSIKNKSIKFAGNRKLKMYGNLSCSSGKRIKIVNRVSFTVKRSLVENGYFPYAHWLGAKYVLWRQINSNKIGFQLLALWLQNNTILP